MANVEIHKQLYKETFSKNKMPEWKVRFREKCVEKVREARQNLLQMKRQQNISMNLPTSQEIQQLISNQWIEFKGKEAQHWTPQDEQELSTQELSDLMSLLEEEILREKQLEEEAILKQYEEMQAFEERLLQSQITQLEEDPSISSVNSPKWPQTLLVIPCPVCKTNRLFENKGVIFCGCGLRVDCKVKK